MLPKNINSPLERLESDFLDSYDINIFLKRDDLISPFLSGNKWRKLKYNLQYIKDKGIDKILTFGGAYSNHIYSTAYACKKYNIRSIGIIRGDELVRKPLNRTLQFAKKTFYEINVCQ